MFLFSRHKTYERVKEELDFTLTFTFILHMLKHVGVERQHKLHLGLKQSQMETSYWRFIDLTET